MTSNSSILTKQGITGSTPENAPFSLEKTCKLALSIGLVQQAWQHLQVRFDSVSFEISPSGYGCVISSSQTRDPKVTFGVKNQNEALLAVITTLFMLRVDVVIGTPNVSEENKRRVLEKYVNEGAQALSYANLPPSYLRSYGMAITGRIANGVIQEPVTTERLFHELCQFNAISGFVALIKENHRLKTLHVVEDKNVQHPEVKFSKDNSVCNILIPPPGNAQIKERAQAILEVLIECSLRICYEDDDQTLGIDSSPLDPEDLAGTRQIMMTTLKTEALYNPSYFLYLLVRD